ncbi:MAG: GNAT family N-acetyltransferase [Minicystis sp.]
MIAPSLVPIAEARVGEAAALLARAFLDDPGYVYALPDEARRPAQLRWVYERILRLSLPYGHVCGLVDERAELLAITVWMPTRRGPGPWEMVRHGMLEFPIRVGVKETVRLVRCLVHMERTKAELCAKRPHWYLDQLAVEPGRQGQGLGRLALGMSSERVAAEERLPSLLFTSKERNVPFYQGSGFAVTRSDWIGAPDDGFRLWAMQREL